MRGTIIEHTPKKGKKTFGYSLYLGRHENGTQIRRVKRGFSRKNEAEEALRKAIEERERRPAPERTMPTFAEFFERWHSQCGVGECGPKTEERYFELAQYAIRLFGDVSLDQLDTMMLAAHMKYLQDHGGRKTKEHPTGRPLAAKTIRHVSFLVQSCLEQALNWELISRNPMRKVKKPKVPRRRPKVVDRAGFDSLLRRSRDG